MRRGLVRVSFGYYGSVGCQSHLRCALCHHGVAGFRALGNFGTHSIGSTEFHLLFAVSVGMNLQIHKVESLCLGNGFVGHGQHAPTGGTFSEHLSQTAGHNVSTVVKLKSNRHKE